MTRGRGRPGIAARGARPEASTTVTASPVTSLATTSLLAVALVLATLAPAAAEDEAQPVGSLGAYAALGLGKHYRLGQWTPIVLHATNHGPAFRGVAIYHEGGPAAGEGEGRTEYVRRIEFPQHSRKRITMLVRPTLGAGKQEVRLVPDDRRAEPISLTLQASAVSGGDRFVGVIGRGGGSIRALEEHWAPEEIEGELVVARLSTRNLPDAIEGYAGLDDVVWLEPSDAPVDPARLAVVLDWVAAGGHLVLVAGEDWNFLQAPGLEDVVPMDLVGREPYPGDRLRGVVGSVALPLKESPLLARGSLRDGARVVMGQPDWPLLVRRAHGGGVVDLFTFHPERRPFARSELSIEAWRRSLAPPGAEERGGGGLLEVARAAFSEDQNNYLYGQLFRQRVEDTLSELPTLEPIRLGWLIVVMGLYVFFIGPVDYFVLKKMGKLEWTWLTFPALILVFTALVYGLSLLNRSGELVESGLEVVDLASGEPRGRINALYGLVSPRRARLDVVPPRPELLIDAHREDLSMGYGLPSTVQATPRLRQGDGVRLELPIHKWDISYVTMSGAYEVEGAVEAVLEHGPGFPTLTLGGDLDLRSARALLVTEAWVAEIDSLPGPGGTVPIDPRSDVERSVWHWMREDLDGGWDPLRWKASDERWPLLAVTALSFRGVTDAALDPNQHYLRYQPGPAWGEVIDLGLEPSLPLLVVDGGPLDEGVRIEGFEPSRVGRRVLRIRVEQAERGGDQATGGITS